MKLTKKEEVLLENFRKVHSVGIYALLLKNLKNKVDKELWVNEYIELSTTIRKRRSALSTYIFLKRIGLIK